MKKRQNFHKRFLAFLLSLALVITTAYVPELMVQAAPGTTQLITGTWTGDTGAGSGVLDTSASGEGVITMNSVSSGDTWYAPQIISNDFAVKAGKEYAVSFKYKLEGTSNNTLEYIIQENGGSWKVFDTEGSNATTNTRTLTYDAASADSEGYCSYSRTFTADESRSAVHLVFGMGNSEANGATVSLKDISVTADADDSGSTPVIGTNFIDFNLIEQSDYIDGGTDAVVEYQGTKAIITATDWGNDWGADSKWQIQLKQLVPVNPNEVYDFSFKIKSNAARSIFVKLGDLDNDNTVFYQDTVSLEAGVEKVVSGTTTGAVTIEKLMMVLALGDQSNSANTIEISEFTLTGQTSGEVEVTPYIEFDKIDHADFTQDVDAQITYQGTTATITATDWGNDWGADSKWQIQLKNLVPVTANDTYDFSFTVQSEVARNIFVKLGDVDNDGTVYYENTVALEAGVEKVISGTTTADVAIDTLMVMVALGDQSNTTNTITISKMWLKGHNTGWVKAGSTGGNVGVKGKEYDFAATEDNAANDYADPGTAKEGYKLIWADEFDGNYGSANVDAATGLNLDNWAYQLGDGTTDCNNPGWGNKELQAYTGNPKNIGVNEDLSGKGTGDGLLRITASYDDAGYVYGDESSKRYTSSRIRTTKADETLFNTTYGYIEARMSLPGTQGAWPAFWMLPQSTSIYGGWPVSGELDIMETCGAFANGSNAQTCSTLHFGAPDHVYEGSGYVTLNSDYTYFHTYAVDWQPGQITWYYDGKAIYTMNDWTSGYAGASDTLTFDAPFDQPYYILLNLAVDSGQFGGATNKATFQDDINMYVDYVRVYQKEAGYADYAQRSTGMDTTDDWSNYAGINQIAPIKADNIVSDVAGGDVNGLEQSGTVDASKWYLGYQSDATDATAEGYTDGNGAVWAKVGVNTKGSQDYSVQLIGHYNAKAGYVYKVSFDAYADGGMVGKTINCDSKEWKGWSTFGIQSFELKDTPTRVSYLISQKKDFENCRIEFNLGARGSGNVYLGNVKVEIVDPASLGAESENRNALANGNIIYNGTFDQGNKRIGYWTAAQGTKLEVPRYTTTKLADSDVSVVDVASKTNYEGIANGVKYYERRAQISAEAGKAPIIYQSGMKMIADHYDLGLDVYSAADTDVIAAIYSANEAGVPSKLVKAATISYKAASGVKHLTWSIDLDETIENAALVLKFGNGASVQVDNVTLIGKSQGEKVDETPVTADSEWSADDGSGGVLPLEKNAGVYTLRNITSGANWYCPQIKSKQFSLVNGKQYKLSMKYKLEGTSNNTAQYIVQEQNGQWHVFAGGPTTITYDASKADADGFCSYELTFTADTSLSTVAIGFGLGGSEANGAADFSFKDVTLTYVPSGSEEGGESSDTWSPVTEDIMKDNSGQNPDKPDQEDPKPEPPKPGDDSKPNTSGGQAAAAPEIKADWNHVKDMVENAKKAQPKENVTINEVVGNDMIISEELYGMLKGENIVLALSNGDGVTISVEGNKLKGRNREIDLSLSKTNTKIPAAVLAEKAKDAYRNKLVIFNSSDSLPDGLNMHFRFGTENAGRYANLYRYDETTGRLVYQWSFKITDEGAAMFALRRTAPYFITVTDSMPVRENGNYTVVPGDTLGRIARRNGVSLAQLLNWNPQITNPNRIRVGQSIFIR